MPITTLLMGGIANQLFQYAAGRVLAKKYNSQLIVNTSFLHNKSDAITRRPYALDDFALKIDKVENVKPSDKDNIITEEKLSSPSSFLKSPPDSFLIGYWQGCYYIEKIKDELLETIKPAKPLSKKSQAHLVMIKQSPSVFLHIRRGDYVHSPMVKQFHGALPIHYYEKAMKMLDMKIPDAIFFIFSDDIDWVKNNLPIGSRRHIYIDQNQGKDSWQDFILMSHCRHAIIANSSFSWLAAYLLSLRHVGAQVVAPNEWFRKTAVNKKLWYPKDWHVLSTKFTLFIK
ncbi:MAG: alpha-1,2-fucosyltransferase [Alphaproteobacteria bacterium]